MDYNNEDMEKFPKDILKSARSVGNFILTQFKGGWELPPVPILPSHTIGQADPGSNIEYVDHWTEQEWEDFGSMAA